MRINIYTIRLATKKELREMMNYLKSLTKLTDKEVHYYNLIDIKLTELEG